MVLRGGLKFEDFREPSMSKQPNRTYCDPGVLPRSHLGVSQN